MTQLKYMQVDVFANEFYKGNPVAVVFGADHLTDQQMKDIARWTNLSETTFVCQPDNELADYRLRILRLIMNYHLQNIHSRGIICGITKWYDT